MVAWALLASVLVAQHAPNPPPFLDESPPNDPAAVDEVPPVGDAPPTEPVVEDEPLREGGEEAEAVVTDARVRLVYSAGPWASVCPELDEVRDAIHAHLGYDPFAEPADRVVLLLLDTTTGEDGPAPDRARVELLDKNLRSLGTRSVTSTEGCAELVATAALQVSIAVDPARAGQPRPLTPEPRTPVDPAAPVGPETTPTASPPPSSPSATPATPPIVLDKLEIPPGFFGVDGHIAALLTPQRFMFGGTAYAGFRWDWFSTRLEFRLDFPGDQSSTTSLPLLMAVAPCVHLPVFRTGPDESIEVTGCATVTGGVIPATGVYRGLPLYLGMGGRTGLDWRFEDASSVRGFVQIEGAVVPPEYSSSSGNSYIAPPVNALVGVGVDLPSL